MSINVWAPAHWWSPFLHNRVCQNVSPLLLNSRCLFCCPVMDIVPPLLFSQDVSHTHTDDLWKRSSWHDTPELCLRCLKHLSQNLSGPILLSWCSSWREEVVLLPFSTTGHPAEVLSSPRVLTDSHLPSALPQHVLSGGALIRQPNRLKATVMGRALAQPEASIATTGPWWSSKWLMLVQCYWQLLQWCLMSGEQRAPFKASSPGFYLRYPVRISSRALTNILSCFEGEMIDAMLACSLAEGPKCRKTAFLWDEWHFCGHLIALPSTLEHIQISVLIKLRKLSSSKLQASAVWQNSDGFLLN